MSKNKMYHFLCALYAFIELALLIFVFVMDAKIKALPEDQVNDAGIIFLFIVPVILVYILVGWLDIKLRKIEHGSFIERLLTCIVVSPIRMGFEIFTIVKIYGDDGYGLRGEYKKGAILNRAYYVLFNADHEELLLPDRVKRKMAERKEQDERARKERQQKEEKRKAEIARLQGVKEAELAEMKNKISACNVKLCMFGCLNSGGNNDDNNRYFDAKFYNRDFEKENKWESNYGSIATVENNYGEPICCYYVKDLFVDGVKMNNKAFSDHLNFNLKPGTYNVKLNVVMKSKVYGYEENSNLSVDAALLLTPSNSDVPKTKIVERYKTFEINNFVVSAGYKYHLALLARIYPIWREVYHKQTQAFLYKTRSRIEEDYSFGVMNEGQIKTATKCGYIEEGIHIDQIN